MSTVRIQTGTTERLWTTALDASLVPLTGLTDLLVSVVRESDGFSLDWNDDTFKSTGWTTRQLAMTELSAANYPGEYYTDLDTSAITNPSTDDTYQIRVVQSPGTTVRNIPQTGEIKVGQWPDDIDAAISSRSSHTPAQAADAVWNEAAADHIVSGTMGLWLNFLRYRGEVWIDTNASNTNTVTGTDGTAENPVSTLAAALTIATNLGVKSLVLTNGSIITLTSTMTSWGIRAVDSGSVVDLNGQDVSNTLIEGCGVVGTQGGVSLFILRKCIVYYASNLSAFARDCTFGIQCSLSNALSCIFENCIFGDSVYPMVINYTGFSVGHSFFNCSGRLQIEDMVSSHSLCYQGRGELEIRPSCVGANVMVSGNVEVIDNGTATNLDINAAVTKSEIDSELSTSHGSGSWEGATAPAVADAVWDESKAGHVAAGSFGEEIQAKAKPGDEMDLVADAVDSDSVAASGANEIRDSILSDSTPFDGANIDAAISSRSSHTPADVDTELSGTHGAGSWEAASVDLGIIRGLLHDKALLDNIVENGQDNLLTGRLRIYDSKANQEAAEASSPTGGTTGLLYTFTVRATYDVTGRLLRTYVIVPEP